MQDAPFYTVGRHPIKRANLLNCRFGAINSAKDILDPNELDASLKQREKAEPPAHYKQSKFDHDRPFNPTGNRTTNKRVHDFIGGFPQFMKDGYGKVAVRKEADPDEKARFKHTHKGLTTPCPSIATNFRNLKTAGAILRR